MERVFMLILIVSGMLVASCRDHDKEESVKPKLSVVADSNQPSQPFGIHKLVLGQYQTNCYVLQPTAKQGECVIIDTSLDEMAPLMKYLKTEAMQPAAVICTHGHDDHINGVDQLHERYPGIRIYVHRDDAESFNGKVPHEVLTIIEKEDLIAPAGIHLQVMPIPGHSPGSICLYSRQEKAVLVGDVLFKGSIGKSSDSNMPILVKGIKEKLLALPDETVIYPGHGPATTIEHERQLNPFLR